MKRSIEHTWRVINKHALIKQQVTYRITQIEPMRGYSSRHSQHQVSCLKLKKSIIVQIAKTKVIQLIPKSQQSPQPQILKNQWI